LIATLNMTDSQVTFLTRDGARIEVPCASGDTVLAAAENAGYFLPAMCHQGTCGLCHAQVTQGRYEMSSYSETALNPAVQGEVLLCRCKPEEDLTVQLPCRQDQISRQRIPVRDAVIERIEQAWERAISLSLRLKPDPDLGDAADFVPGQYMELCIPGTDIRRAYSLANLPNWEGLIEFLIRIQPNGQFSTWLSEQAKVGDVLTVRGPAGRFVLDEASPRPKCFVGGGCGLAPLLSMLRHLGDFQDSQPAHLIFGANQQAELLPATEIASLRSALPQLDVTLAVMKPEPDWNGFTGNAAEALNAYLESLNAEPDIYVCGPPKMLMAVEAVAEKYGFAGRVIAERL
jgi:NAD(P)H-flavin reductase/ferredoxin